MIWKEIGNLTKLILALNVVLIGFYKPSVLLSIGDILSYSKHITAQDSPENTGDLNLQNAPKGIEVDIAIDSLGIPHIYSKNEISGAFATGYMHAQDRYFQMELIVRTVKGNLAELLGKPAVGSDVFWRPYDFEAEAKILLDETKKKYPKSYEYLLAYSNGINYYLKNERKESASPEYKLLNASPIEWKPYYSFLVSWYLSYTLTYRDININREALQQRLPDSLYNELYSIDTMNYSYVMPGINFKRADSTPLQKVNLKITGLQNFNKTEYNKGSNNWAISNTKSKDGAAYLCNDTHLKMMMPNPWYEIHIDCADFKVYGFSIPGLPYVIAGHNSHISWGITNANWDVLNKYKLQLNDNGSQYLSCKRWRNLIVKTFPIKVNGGEDTIIIQKYSSFGPVYSSDNQSYAIKWFPAERNFSFVALFQLQSAENWEQFTKALSVYDYPAQNFAYADTKGNIGMVVAGKLPIRPLSYKGGLLSDENFDSIRFVAYDLLPKSFNPANGSLSSANQFQWKSDLYLNSNEIENYRATRICQLLNAHEKLNIQDMKDIQGDKTDLAFFDLLTLIKKYSDRTSSWKLLEGIRAWDGNMLIKSSKPLVFEEYKYTVVTRFCRLLDSAYAVRYTPNFSNIASYLNKHETIVLNGIRFDTKTFLLECIKDCENNLVKDYGINYSCIPYEEFKYNESYFIEHIAKFPGIGYYLKNKGGNANTIDLNSSSFASTFRFIVQNNNEMHSFAILAGGQSGRFNSSNFSNQIDPWKKVEYHECQFAKDKAAIKGVVRSIKIN